MAFIIRLHTIVCVCFSNDTVTCVLVCLCASAFSLYCLKATRNSPLPQQQQQQYSSALVECYI